tara:strand:+ start:38 stop:682 length:645 start_codon:yes stop_codon:yes gene_type:complete
MTLEKKFKNQSDKLDESSSESEEEMIKEDKSKNKNVSKVSSTGKKQRTPAQIENTKRMIALNKERREKKALEKQSEKAKADKVKAKKDTQYKKDYYKKTKKGAYEPPPENQEIDEENVEVIKVVKGVRRLKPKPKRVIIEQVEESDDEESSSEESSEEEAPPPPKMKRSKNIEKTKPKPRQRKQKDYDEYDEPPTPQPQPLYRPIIQKPKLSFV